MKSLKIKGNKTDWSDKQKKDKIRYGSRWGEYWCNIFQHSEMKAQADVCALCLMKGNINKYGCLLWSKKEIAVPKHLSCCWRSIKRDAGEGGGTIEMQMLMMVAEDNHSRSAQAQCERVDAVCGSQQTHLRRAATCCTPIRIDGQNKLGPHPNPQRRTQTPFRRGWRVLPPCLVPSNLGVSLPEPSSPRSQRIARMRPQSVKQERKRLELMNRYPLCFSSLGC